MQYNGINVSYKIVIVRKTLENIVGCGPDKVVWVNAVHIHCLDRNILKNNKKWIIYIIEIIFGICAIIHSEIENIISS